MRIRIWNKFIPKYYYKISLLEWNKFITIYHMLIREWNKLIPVYHIPTYLMLIRE